MGCFYFGNQFKNYVNARFKVGTTGEKTPAQRLTKLRQDHTNFELMCYLPLIDDTKAEREAVEHHVKMMMLRKFSELSHDGNDHFTFKTNKDEHKEKILNYAASAIAFAQNYCDDYDIKYKEIVCPNYKKCGVRNSKKKKT